MALSSSRLGNAMADAVLTFVSPAPGSSDETELRNLMIALATEIIDEITTNADVATTVTGVTTGPGTANGTGGVS